MSVPMPAGAAGQPWAGRTPLLLKLLAVLLVAYALLPSLGAFPVATEGFEAAVTSAANQSHAAPSAVPFPEYNYSSRPGEFWAYRLGTALVPVDAMIVGQALALLANLAAVAGIILVARRGSIARPWVAVIAYCSMFDLASNMAQVSASNLAAGLLALGAGLFMIPGVASAVAATVVLALAVFCRLDVLVLIPFALLCPAMVCLTLASPPFKAFLLRSTIAGLAVGALALALYALAGSSILGTLQQNKGVAFQIDGAAIKRAFTILLPWTSIPAVLGVTVGQLPAWRHRPLLAATRAVVVGAPAVTLVAIYLGQMDTPRFIAPAAPFLALGAALLIEAVIAAPRGIRLAAAAVLALAVLTTWSIRKPFYVWDGFRYRWATFLSPWEMYRQKVFLDASNGPMFDDVLERSCAACQGENLSILSIEWRQFNEITRRVILAGGTLESSQPSPLGDTVPKVEYRFDLQARKVTVVLLETPRDFQSPAQLIDVANILTSDGRATVLGSTSGILHDLLAARPDATIGYSADFPPWDHLSTVVLHVPRRSRKE